MRRARARALAFVNPQAGRARPLAAETRGAMPREDSRGAASSKCLGAARCRCSSDRAPGWRRRKGSVAGARVVVFAEHAALALAVDELQEPADGARTLFFTHRMRLGSCWRRNKNPREVARPYFFTHRMRPGSCWRRNKNPPILGGPYFFTHRTSPGSCCLVK